MNFAVGIVAEPWERAYGWATIEACLGLIDGCDRLLVPDFLTPLPDTIRAKRRPCSGRMRTRLRFGGCGV